ncbi:hypothetical protein DXG01_013381 [Tephrocybe rancida]|nr:hypothetical protein DXG01_013381 [Tephrocybe rancida]
MQRSNLVYGALRGISALIGDRFTPRPPDPSHAYVEFRPQRRTCDMWQQEVLEVFDQSKPDDYASARSRLLNERVVEIRTYKLKADDAVYSYFVAAIATGPSSPGHHVYMRLEMGPLTYPAIVDRLDSWPKDSKLLVEQTRFTEPAPLLLDLILLAPIVAKMKPTHYEYKNCEFFFADLVVRALQELFYFTCPKTEAKYTSSTFVIVEASREDVKQPPRCFVLRLRSEMLDEIEPAFVERRRTFGLKVRDILLMN